jgi:phosphoribosyl 1,2-cyclic phosphodiesterase
MGVSPSRLSGILVTHEHNDHIKGIPMLMRRYAVPVIGDPRTLGAVEQFIKKVVEAAARRWKTVDDLARPVPQIEPILSETAAFKQNEATAEGAFEAGEAMAEASATSHLFVPFPIGSQHLFGDVEVTSFPTSHDAVAPCGYLLCADRYRVCVVIDTGRVTPEARHALRGSVDS